MKQFLILIAISVSFAIQLTAQQKPVFSKNNIAVNGYDVVAYFTQSKAIKGVEEYAVYWKETKWLFSTASNAALFKENPEKYTPQYGGYCAYGCSRGYKAKTEPEAWSIVNGKLYLNYNLQVRDTWKKDIDNYIKKANAKWPAIENN